MAHGNDLESMIGAIIEIIITLYILFGVLFPAFCNAGVKLFCGI